MKKLRHNITEKAIEKEKAHFEDQVKKRLPPRRFDVMEEYYWPLTTFGERGNPSFRCDNRYYFYKRHLDELKRYKGKCVLNVACGTGELSLYRAYCGCKVVAFDFSLESVEYAREMARLNGYADRIQVDRMDVRNLSYQPERFDLITGEAALHHLIKFENCLENLYRVLKADGKAVFLESFIFDPLISLMRPVHNFFKRYVGEHNLGTKDIRYAESVFDEVIISERAVFYTYSRFFATPTPFNRKVARFLKRLDNAVLPRFPFLKRFYSLTMIEMFKR